MKGVRKRLYANKSWPQLLTIICSNCGEEKEKSEYYKNRYICRGCLTVRAQRRMKKVAMKKDEVAKEGDREVKMDVGVEEEREESVVLYYSDGSGRVCV